MNLEYQNPVWPGYFADPFVLKAGGEYFAYGTAGPDEAASSRKFQVLRSVDLVNWRAEGSALIPPETLRYASFWAPEVAERDGRFYMYYSAGGVEGEGHKLRVAIADAPVGPFVDVAGSLVPDEPFSIDASPYRDPTSGEWYLFFAKDYFDDPPGTGLAVARLSDDMFRTVGPPTPLIRASSPWQVFGRNRHWYGQTWEAWHTVEGPFAVSREGKCWLFYSGGLWKGADYGVGCAVSDSPMGPYTEVDCTDGPPILRGTDAARGPGHNSVVLGPDDQTWFIVYHAWDAQHTARRMFIDPLEWTPAGPRCAGPTTERQRLALP